MSRGHHVGKKVFATEECGSDSSVIVSVSEGTELKNC